MKLFFYRDIPVLLRPASFSYMLLLAQRPGELIPRDVIYRCLWPGEMNFEGTDKPYERQITDPEAEAARRHSEADLQQDGGWRG